MLVTLFCLVFCLALWGAGALWQRCTAALPPVPQFPGSLFPNVWDQLLTLAFICFFTAQVLGKDAPGEESGDLSITAAVLLLFSQVLVYAPMLARYFSLPRRPRPALGAGTKALMVIGALAVMYTAAGITEACGLNEWLMRVTGCPDRQDVVQALSEGGKPVRTATIALMAVLQAPVCEECAFRGFLYTILRRYAGRGCAMVAAGLFFGAIHGSLPQLLPLAVFGMVQCWVYEKTRSLALPIAIHMIFNGLACLALLAGME